MYLVKTCWVFAGLEEPEPMVQAEVSRIEGVHELLKTIQCRLWISTR